MQEEIRHVRLERDTLHQSLDTSQEQLQGLKNASDAAREDFERARMTSEAELQRLAAEYADAQQRLEQVRTDLEQTLERVSSEHAAERARLETLVIERDTQLEEQAVRHSASQDAASNALMQIEDRLRLALEASSRDRREIDQLQGALEARGQELEATRSDREVLRTQADRVPQLQNQLEDTWAENRRQFERTPYGICRVGRDGALKHVNHALVALLRYRTGDDLLRVDFAHNIFESGDDLRLLIERCVSSGMMESVETTWRRKDRSRLVVRLFALPAVSESIEIVVEDITDLRALGEKLRQVQPMEAMARLATEVAGTCDNVLRGVSHDARQWLATIDSDTALRHEGERLLHEVTRAAGFLRQLGVYGNKQMTALEPIDVNRVLRDLEPVLKRVAGDDIELVMPKMSSPVNVAVEAERIERVLVNVASFGRERMPLGGRLRIELATVVVGPKFVAKYPNVRTGDHVLITITEMSGGFRSDSPIRPPRKPAGANTTRSVSDRPGVDLGVLQGLIRDCGGHLWIKAEPTGDMVLKVRLPQPLLDDSTERPTGGPRSDRGRSMARWFRH
jgi:nitrogen-specific signal transduction histidine kinase